jgi:uncharacterized membrane protein YhiD involved in acid resistance
MEAGLTIPALGGWAVLAIASAAFVIGAMIWLKRLRRNLANAVADALNRQIHHGTKVEEALNVLQRNQKQMETHVQALAQSQQRARTDLNTLAQKLEQKEMTSESAIPRDRVLH